MVENEIVKLWIQDGILYSRFKNATYLTLNNVKEYIELRHLVSNNESQYWCMDIGKLRYISREAKNYIDDNGQELIHACAVIVNSLATKFMAEGYIRYSNTKVPMKCFNSEEKGIAWLNEMRQRSI